MQFNVFFIIIQFLIIITGTVIFTMGEQKDLYLYKFINTNNGANFIDFFDTSINLDDSANTIDVIFSLLSGWILGLYMSLFIIHIIKVVTKITSAYSPQILFTRLVTIFMMDHLTRYYIDYLMTYLFNPRKKIYIMIGLGISLYYNIKIINHFLETF